MTTYIIHCPECGRTSTRGEDITAQLRYDYHRQNCTTRAVLVESESVEETVRQLREWGVNPLQYRVWMDT